MAKKNKKNIQATLSKKSDSFSSIKTNSSDPYRLDFYKLFWIFMIGCFMGVVFESFYFLFAHHHLEIRAGVIYGPFNPVYGFGASLITICLNWLRNKGIIFIYLGSTVVGGVFEYLCSAIQELVFGTVSWDYSNTFLNFNGRTNLFHSLVWGLLGLIWIKLFYSRISDIINYIPHKILKFTTIALSIFMSLNMLISFMAVERQSQRREGVPATNAVSQFLDKYYTDEYLDKIYLSTKVTES